MAKLKWLVAALVAAVVLVVGGTWVYINVVRDDAPERLDQAFATTTVDEGDLADESDEPTTTTESADTLDSVDGVWVPTSDSVLGYRVGEVLFGQTTEGVGRTNQVSGQLVIDDTTILEADFEVDLASIESDDERRDGQFRGRIMDVATYPTATLVLAEAIELDQIPADLEVLTLTAQVDLTLRGNTQTVPIELQARLNGFAIEISGSHRIVFAEWGIPNPSTVGITTEDHGELEFLLVLTPA